MDSNILIYQPNVKDTYLYYIKENISLIRKIFDEYENQRTRYDPRKRHELYISKGKHLQIMTLIGLTTEHLVKISLLKRGFVLNKSKLEPKFQKEFLMELNQAQNSIYNQEQLDQLYINAEKNVKPIIDKKLISFDECITCFNKSIPTDYYENIGTYIISPISDTDNVEKYFGFDRIRGNDALRTIQRMRNSYLHLPEAKGEQNGIVWYLFNFLVWLCKKEYPDFFADEEFIGSDTAIRYFQ